ncbi:hypothetical protein AJ78_08009 [Emergomyces pasteurianus Ep9510]|uniref:RNA helicase n=1 Tax=Emergomyces pasteurianus Ep9510 TaxID=1447872 RepID=A0A1J9Q4I3_9EURO|nr:hypothetical protein AJ78_08009 [Emergomyces pasteurianus Ep9510]
MAASFYSRYIPPRNDLSLISADSLVPTTVTEIRKRRSSADDDSIPAFSPPKKARKNEGYETSEVSAAVIQSQNGTARRHHAKSDPDSKAEGDISPLATEEQAQIQTEHNSRQGRKQKMDTRNECHRVQASHGAAKTSTDSVDVPDQGTNIVGGEKQSERKLGSKRKLDQAIDKSNKIGPAKHTEILSKFEKSKLKARSAASGKNESNDAVNGDGEAPITPHGLEPLPQPAPAPVDLEAPTYSTLPAWLTQPFTATASLQRNFSDLGVNQRLVSILEKRGYGEAFPIQAAVLELLRNGENRHSGDLCISAATGSGKTLAYALPLVAAIEPLSIPKLRGLVVVPTRELVKQARDACELCATGTGLRIGTAVGAASLNEEQALLVKYDPFYSPPTGRIENKRQITAESWTSFNLHEYIIEAERPHTTFPNHVTNPSPNIDILICTPGRLVDHIRSTKGFTLDHLEWLVIDEADRLLNGSFQEWVQIVIPALKRDTTSFKGKGGRILEELGWDIHKPPVQKIILSATMTKDIAKLNSLQLQNAKLVVPDTPRAADTTPFHLESNADINPKDDHAFSLPSALSEIFVPVGDGADKPLYLLTLLLDYFKLDGGNTTTLPRRPSNSVSSDSNPTSSSSTLSDNSLSDESSSKVWDISSNTDSSKELVAHDGSPKLTGLSAPSVLVFTKSSESASRLSRLLALMHPPFAPRIGTLIKSNKSSTSRKTLSAYRNGKLSIIIATDRASRGLDLPSLSYVVSYDIPTSLTSYIHRVGRTARAGRSGSAWSLVAHREGRWFANEIVKCPGSTVTRARNVEKVNVKLDEAAADLKKQYVDALGELQVEVEQDRIKHRKLAKSKLS